MFGTHLPGGKRFRRPRVGEPACGECWILLCETAATPVWSRAIAFKRESIVGTAGGRLSLRRPDRATLSPLAATRTVESFGAQGLVSDHSSGRVVLAQAIVRAGCWRRVHSRWIHSSARWPRPPGTPRLPPGRPARPPSRSDSTRAHESFGDDANRCDPGSDRVAPSSYCPTGDLTRSANSTTGYRAEERDRNDAASRLRVGAIRRLIGHRGLAGESEPSAGSVDATDSSGALSLGMSQETGCGSS